MNHGQTFARAACSQPPRWPSCKASISRAAAPGFNSRFLQGEFSGSGDPSDLKIGTPEATLPDAWCYRVSAVTGLPGFSIL